MESICSSWRLKKLLTVWHKSINVYSHQTGGGDANRDVESGPLLMPPTVRTSANKIRSLTLCISNRCCCCCLSSVTYILGGNSSVWSSVYFQMFNIQLWMEMARNRAVFTCWPTQHTRKPSIYGLIMHYDRLGIDCTQTYLHAYICMNLYMTRYMTVVNCNKWEDEGASRGWSLRSPVNHFMMN